MEKQRSKMDVSLDDVRDMLWAALQEKNKDAYLSQVYGGYLVYEQGGKHYRLAYSILDGQVQLGSDPVEVEKTWVVVVSQQAEIDDTLVDMVRLVQAQDPEGSVWEVLICEPGFTKNGWYHPESALREAAGLFEGVDVNLYELPGGPNHVPPAVVPVKPMLVKNKAGWIDTVRYAAGEGVRGLLHFLDSAKWLGKNMLSAMKSGTTVYGLSYDAPVRAAQSVVDGKHVMKLLKFHGVDSVDIVSRPAAGGKFIRAVAAQKQEDIMDKKQLWDLINSKRADLLAGKVFDTITDEELTTIARMAMEPVKPAEPAAPAPGAGGAQVGDEPIRAVQSQLDQLRCKMELDSILVASGLPVHAQNRLRSQFGSRVFTADELTRSIQSEKDYLSAIDAANAATGGAVVPDSRVRVGIGSFQKAQIALDKLFGLNQDEMVQFSRMSTLEGQPFFVDRDHRGQEVIRSAQSFDDYAAVPQFRGIREAYTYFTGDPDVTGFMRRQNLPPDLRAAMDITSATFTYALGNTMARRLVRAYRQMNFKTDLLISIRKPVKDFRTQEAVLIGGFPDPSDVDPEAADFVEIAPVTDEESTYTIAQSGNLLTITRKTIINDDIMLIIRLLDSFGRAFARKHGKYVWNRFVNNTTCSDGTAWFTGAGAHVNLGAAALTHATALIAYTALATMTEKDSGEVVGLVDGSFKLNLVGPVNIMNLMERISKEEFYYSSNDLTTKLPNPLFGKVDSHVIPLLTDANDWGMLLPPSQIDMIEMGYLNGREEPEFFVADMPQAEQVFVADKIRHKGRHEYAGTVIDYRGGYKAEVA